MNIVQFFWK